MSSRRRPEALLLDFDGVLRVWDASRTAAVEEKYGLPPGLLAQAAFDWPRMRAALVGEVTDAAWMSGVARAIADLDGAIAVSADRAAQAVAEWQSYRGAVDPDVLALVRAVRAAGRPVALATNATDRLPADLAALGLAGEFDAVVNSSELGAAARSSSRPPAPRSTGHPTGACWSTTTTGRCAVPGSPACPRSAGPGPTTSATCAPPSV